MGGKRNLSALLSAAPGKPVLRRGQGVQLSTQATAPEMTASDPQDRILAAAQNRENAAGPKRVNRGYALREDLIKACKRIALEEDRTLYEVMEEALEQYLARHQGR